MRARTAPRYQGTITSWKDERGFGFIAPNGGGPAVFVHIKAFARRGVRPTERAIVTYELGVNDKGQPRALNVLFAGELRPERAGTAPRRCAMPVAVGFLGVLAVLAMAGLLPRLIFFVYLGMSAFAFLAYAIDKAAARDARRRTPETTLHCLSLLGGWPGALLAQGLLRHKSLKASFQSVFRWTVAVNCIALFWLITPVGMRPVRALLGVAQAPSAHMAQAGQAAGRAGIPLQPVVARVRAKGFGFVARQAGELAAGLRIARGRAGAGADPARPEGVRLATDAIVAKNMLN